MRITPIQGPLGQAIPEPNTVSKDERWTKKRDHLIRILNYDYVKDAKDLKEIFTPPTLDEIIKRTRKP